MEELTKIKNSVKRNLSLDKTNVDKAIELTYKETTKGFIKTLRNLTK